MTLNVAPGRYAAEALADGRVRELLHRLELTVNRRLDGVLQGEYLGLVPGHGTEPGEAREYQPGDDVRRIDWSVTARLDAPHTRETIADRELQTWAVIDLSPSLDFGTAGCEKRDLAIVGLAAAGFLTSRTGNRFGVVVADGSTIESLPATGGRPNLYATLQRVATRPRVGDGAGPTRLAEAIGRLGAMHRRRGLAVVISDFLSHDDWPDALARLAVRHNVLAIEVVDPRELELPDVGLITVVDPETGRRREVQTASAGLRARYAQAADEQRGRIAAAIRRAGADHLTLRTDRDWFDDLIRFVTLRRERAARLPRRGASFPLSPSRPATTPPLTFDPTRSPS
jgi:uncharacterized protein (DUF58 family)